MANEQQAGMLSQAAKGFNGLPFVRQILLMVGLALSVALGVTVVSWLQEPNFRPFLSQLSSKDMAKVVDTLQQSGIEYKINERDGGVYVPGNKIHEARMKLASAGVSDAPASGFASLQNGSSIGTSRFMENARYRHALETELARTISGMQGIKSSRVHLALPRQSAFINEKSKPSASVFVNVSQSQLEKGQVGAVVQLVASSIAGLNPADVTVTDQYGRLLTSKHGDQIALSKQQFQYQQSIQSYYEKQIASMIGPLLGPNKVRVRVFANMDFTHQEQTKEEFNPDKKTLRSEQTIEEKTAAGKGGGKPGAASNNKPAGGGADKKADGNSRSQAIRNYEIGKTISYVKNPVGALKNLSVAVVVDNDTKKDGQSGKVTSTPLSKEKLAKIDNLVKTAIGFNGERGDKVSVVNSAFAPPPTIEALPPLAFYQQPWFWDLVKKGGAVFACLAVGNDDHQAVTAKISHSCRHWEACGG